MERMDPAAKTEWLEALRSGKYTQTRGCLRGDLDEGGVGHCCLGVLIDATEQDPKWRATDIGLGRTAYEIKLNGMIVHGYPPRGYRGLSSYAIDRVAAMNDSPEGKTFVEIADFIEENL